MQREMAGRPTFTCHSRQKGKQQRWEVESSVSISNQSSDCEVLYDSVLNNKSDESEHNAASSGDKDYFLSELLKGYESDDTVSEVSNMRN